MGRRRRCSRTRLSTDRPGRQPAHGRCGSFSVSDWFIYSGPHRSKLDHPLGWALRSAPRLDRPAFIVLRPSAHCPDCRYPPTNLSGTYPPNNYFQTALGAADYNEENAMVDALSYMYSGVYPANRAPVVADPGLTVATTATSTFASGTPLAPGVMGASSSMWLAIGSQYTASIKVTDPEGAPLTYMWQILPRNPGGRRGAPHGALPPR